MKQFIKQSLLIPFLLVLMSATSALAEKKGGIQLKMTVAEEVEVTDSNGQKTIKLLDPVNIVPGDKVVYTTQYHNTGTQKASNVFIKNPIPKDLIYLKGSAEQDNASVTYSINDGENFNTADKLNVKQKDGTKRPAQVQDYTHIRWKIQSVSANEKGTVQFKAILK